MADLAGYDICILFAERDQEIARKLGESICRYRLPSKVSLPDPALDYRRVIYVSDKELSDKKPRAMADASRFLTLICSPATRDNPAIRDFLDTFREKYGKENIIAVIAEGEPIDSFPPSFLKPQPYSISFRT